MFIRRFFYSSDGSVPYYVFRTNWHKIPVVSRLMCWMGRHDYEFMRVDDHGWATLQCFYCQAEKNSK